MESQIVVKWLTPVASILSLNILKAIFAVIVYQTIKQLL